MEENNLLDMDNEMQKYCISQYTIRVSNVGTSLAVDAWNHHHIPGTYACMYTCSLIYTWTV